MTQTSRLTDAALRAALTPGPTVGAPGGLLAAIGNDIRRTRQEQPILHLPGILDLGLQPWAPQLRHLARVVAVVALVAALIGAAIVGADLLRRALLVPTSPTIVETLAPESGVVERVLVDGTGALWAIAPGRLTRFDASGRDRRTWSVSDDPVFGDAVVASASDGGVWLWSGETIRRFAGDGFVDSIAAPSSHPLDLVEASDGALWASSSDLGLLRWDGARWSALPTGGPTGEVRSFLVRADGEVWVGGLAPGVSRLLDGGWRTFASDDDPSMSAEVGPIVEAADGSIWMVFDRSSPRIVRFHRGSWSVIDGPGFPAWWLAAAPDGSIWTLTGQDPPVEVARFADGRWTRFGSADGLEGTVPGAISATPDGVFVGTDAGLFRFADDRWIPAWPAAIPGPDHVQALAAVSADEAWAADFRGIWRFVGGGWQWSSRPWAGVEPFTSALAVGPDGVVWAASDEGIAVLAGGTWRIVSTLTVDALLAGRDGTAWAAAGHRLVELRLTEAGVDVRPIPCPILPARLAAGPDGSVYVGATSPLGLARFDGRTCEFFVPPGLAELYQVRGLTIDGTGALVAWVRESSADGATAIHLARLSVDGCTVTPLSELRVRGDIHAVAAFDGVRWIEVVTGVRATGPVSFAPDGTIWFVGPSGIQRIPADALPAR